MWRMATGLDTAALEQLYTDRSPLVFKRKCIGLIKLQREQINMTSFILKRKLVLQSNSVITNSSGPVIFVRYNRVFLCTKITKLTLKYVRHNRVFVKNRVPYNRISL